MKLNIIKSNSHIFALLCLVSLGCPSVGCKPAKATNKDKVAITDPSLTKDENQIIDSLQQLINVKGYPKKTFLSFAKEVQSILESNPQLKKKYGQAIKVLKETTDEISNSKKKPNVIRIGKKFLKLKSLLPKSVESHFKKYLQAQKLLNIKNGKEEFNTKEIFRIAKKRLQ